MREGSEGVMEVWSLLIFMREWGGFYRMWLLVDVWGIVLKTDKMKDQGAEYFLQSLELIPGYR